MSFSDPVAESVLDPVLDPVAESVLDPVAEPVAESVLDPVAESVLDPVLDPVAEPVLDPVAEPVAESVLDPVAEPVAGPEYNLALVKYNMITVAPDSIILDNVYHLIVCDEFNKAEIVQNKQSNVIVYTQEEFNKFASILSVKFLSIALMITTDANEQTSIAVTDKIMSLAADMRRINAGGLYIYNCNLGRHASVRDICVDIDNEFKFVGGIMLSTDITGSATKSTNEAWMLDWKIENGVATYIQKCDIDEIRRIEDYFEYVSHVNVQLDFFTDMFLGGTVDVFGTSSGSEAVSTISTAVDAIGDSLSHAFTDFPLEMLTITTITSLHVICTKYLVDYICRKWSYYRVDLNLIGFALQKYYYITSGGGTTFDSAAVDMSSSTRLYEWSRLAQFWRTNTPVGFAIDANKVDSKGSGFDAAKIHVLSAWNATISSTYSKTSFESDIAIQMFIINEIVGLNDPSFTRFMTLFKIATELLFKAKSFEMKYTPTDCMSSLIVPCYITKWLTSKGLINYDTVSEFQYTNDLSDLIAELNNTSVALSADDQEYIAETARVSTRLTATVGGTLNGAAGELASEAILRGRDAARFSKIGCKVSSIVGTANRTTVGLLVSAVKARLASNVTEIASKIKLDTMLSDLNRSLLLNAKSNVVPFTTSVSRIGTTGRRIQILGNVVGKAGPISRSGINVCLKISTGMKLSGRGSRVGAILKSAYSVAGKVKSACRSGSLLTKAAAPAVKLASKFGSFFAVLDVASCIWQWSKDAAKLKQFKTDFVAISKRYDSALLALVANGDFKNEQTELAFVGTLQKFIHLDDDSRATVFDADGNVISEATISTKTCPTLESYFNHIVDRLDKFNNKQTDTIIIAIVGAIGTLGLMLCSAGAAAPLVALLWCAVIGGLAASAVVTVTNGMVHTNIYKSIERGIASGGVTSNLILSNEDTAPAAIPMGTGPPVLLPPLPVVMSYTELPHASDVISYIVGKCTEMETITNSTTSFMGYTMKGSFNADYIVPLLMYEKFSLQSTANELAEVTARVTDMISDLYENGIMIEPNTIAETMVSTEYLPKRIIISRFRDVISAAGLEKCMQITSNAVTSPLYEWLGELYKAIPETECGNPFTFAFQTTAAFFASLKLTNIGHIYKELKLTFAYENADTYVSNRMTNPCGGDWLNPTHKSSNKFRINIVELNRMRTFNQTLTFASSGELIIPLGQTFNLYLICDQYNNVPIIPYYDEPCTTNQCVQLSIWKTLGNRTWTNVSPYAPPTQLMYGRSSGPDTLTIPAAASGIYVVLWGAGGGGGGGGYESNSMQVNSFQDGDGGGGGGSGACVGLYLRKTVGIAETLYYTTGTGGTGGLGGGGSSGTSGKQDGESGNPGTISNVKFRGKSYYAYSGYGGPYGKGNEGGWSDFSDNGGKGYTNIDTGFSMNSIQDGFPGERTNVSAGGAGGAAVKFDNAQLLSLAYSNTTAVTGVGETGTSGSVNDNAMIRPEVADGMSKGGGAYGGSGDRSDDGGAWTAPPGSNGYIRVYTFQ